MATLIQSYEQQYSILTADITSKIGRLKTDNEENRDQLIREIQGNFEEANDLLEQLELESRGAGAGSAARVSAYRAELQRVRNEYVSVLNQRDTYIEAEDAYDDWSGNDQQRRLLDERSERLQRGHAALAEGFRVATETEDIGAAVLGELHDQRETIQRARARLRDTNEDLKHSSRITNSMLARALRERFVLVLVVFVVGAALCLALVLRS